MFLKECYVQPLVLSKKMKEKIIRIAVYDFETSQEDEIKPGVLEHRVAFVSLRWTCSRCEDQGSDPDCLICCDQSRSKSWSWYNSDDPLNDFVSFVIKVFGSSKTETILWAHNGGRFDSHFVLQVLYKMNIEPKLVMTGLKIYDITIKKGCKGRLHFRDSWLILQTPLDSLKKTFNLEVEEKMHFPYMFCRRENKDVVLQHLPPIDDYSPSTMKVEKHAKFLVC
jgi:hypothetical protein